MQACIPAATEAHIRLIIGNMTHQPRVFFTRRGRPPALACDPFDGSLPDNV